MSLSVEEEARKARQLAANNALIESTSALRVIGEALHKGINICSNSKCNKIAFLQLKVRLFYIADVLFAEDNGSHKDAALHSPSDSEMHNIIQFISYLEQFTKLGWLGLLLQGNKLLQVLKDLDASLSACLHKVVVADQSTVAADEQPPTFNVVCAIQDRIVNNGGLQGLLDNATALQALAEEIGAEPDVLREEVVYYLKNLNSAAREVEVNSTATKAETSRLAQDADLLKSTGHESIELRGQPTIDKSRVLGRGYFGAVYEGQANGEYVAVKQFSEAAEFSTPQLSQLQKDLSLHKTLINLPGVLSIYGANLTTQPRCIVMELADGSLHDALHNRIPIIDLSLASKLSLAVQVASAVAAIHSLEVIHGDIKSSNVLLFLQGGGRVTSKLADFGLGAFNRLDGSSQALSAKSSAPCIAPELFAGGCCTAGSDVYAFAVLLNELLTEEVPFVGESYADVKRNVTDFQERPFPFRPSAADVTGCQLLRLVESSWQQDPKVRMPAADLHRALSTIFQQAVALLRRGAAAQESIPLPFPPPVTAQPASTMASTATQRTQLNADFYRARCSDTAAVERIEAAVATGDHLAEGYLSILYVKGCEVIKKDMGHAQHYAQLCVPWLQEEAGKGCPHSQFLLGSCHSAGVGVPKKSEATAAKFYAQAAEQGHAAAQCSLGVAYSTGSGGLPTDHKKAFELYKLAAAQNYAIAQFNLANCYAEAMGVAENQREATRYFELAAQQGHAGARTQLENRAPLAREWSTSERAEAAVLLNKMRTGIASSMADAMIAKDARRVKVILVGPPGTGKSAVVRKLLIGRFDEDHVALSHGVHFHSWRNEDVVFRLCDLAGHEMYYHTHKFFFDSSAIFMVFCDLSNSAESTVLDYIHFVRNYAPHAPIMLVRTHANKLPPLSTERIQELQDLHPTVVGYYHVDCKSSAGMAELKADMTKIALSLSCAQEPLTAGYLNVVQRLKEMSNSCFSITMTEFFEIGVSLANLTRMESGKLLVLLLSYGEVQKLPFGPIVLHPGYLAGLLMLAITPQSNFQHYMQGTLSHEDFDKKIWQSCSPSERPILLELLHRNDLAYPLYGPSGIPLNQSLVPAMLPLSDKSVTQMAQSCWADFTSHPLRYVKLEIRFQVRALTFFATLQARLHLMATRGGAWKQYQHVHQEDVIAREFSTPENPIEGELSTALLCSEEKESVLSVIYPLWNDNACAAVLRTIRTMLDEDFRTVKIAELNVYLGPNMVTTQPHILQLLQFDLNADCEFAETFVPLGHLRVMFKEFDSIFVFSKALERDNLKISALELPLPDCREEEIRSFPGSIPNGAGAVVVASTLNTAHGAVVPASQTPPPPQVEAGTEVDKSAADSAVSSPAPELLIEANAQIPPLTADPISASTTGTVAETGSTSLNTATHIPAMEEMPAGAVPSPLVAAERQLRLRRLVDAVKRDSATVSDLYDISEQLVELIPSVSRYCNVSMWVKVIWVAVHDPQLPGQMKLVPFTPGQLRVHPWKALRPLSISCESAKLPALASEGTAQEPIPWFEQLVLDSIRELSRFQEHGRLVDLSLFEEQILEIQTSHFEGPSDEEEKKRNPVWRSAHVYKGSPFPPSRTMDEFCPRMDQIQRDVTSMRTDMAGVKAAVAGIKTDIASTKTLVKEGVYKRHEHPMIFSVTEPEPTSPYLFSYMERWVRHVYRVHFLCEVCGRQVCCGSDGRGYKLTSATVRARQVVQVITLALRVIEIVSLLTPIPLPHLSDLTKYLPQQGVLKKLHLDGAVRKAQARVNKNLARFSTTTAENNGADAVRACKSIATGVSDTTVHEVEIDDVYIGTVKKILTTLEETIPPAHSGLTRVIAEPEGRCAWVCKSPVSGEDCRRTFELLGSVALLLEPKLV